MNILLFMYNIIALTYYIIINIIGCYHATYAAFFFIPSIFSHDIFTIFRIFMSHVILHIDVMCSYHNFMYPVIYIPAFAHVMFPSSTCFSGHHQHSQYSSILAFLVSIHSIPTFPVLHYSQYSDIVTIPAFLPSRIPSIPPFPV